MTGLPIYTTSQSVKVRLANKVQFQEDKSGPIQGELPDELLAQLIVDAETAVEQDLRNRYAIPFRSNSHGTWEALPDHSRRAIRTVVDWKAVIMILSTDFGRGSHIDGDNYKKDTAELYEAEITKLLGQDQEGKSRDRFRFSPPLEDLKLARSNSKADDGYRGRLINTDASTSGAESYAAEQINNPAEAILRRRLAGIL